MKLLVVFSLMCIMCIHSPSKAASGVGLGCDAYYGWVNSCLSSLDKDMPQTTECAEDAALRFIGQNWDLAVWGEPSMESEATYRAGGMVPINTLKDGDSPMRTIIIVFLDENQLEQQVAQLATFERNGNMFIAFGRKPILQKAEKLGDPFDYTIENHAAVHGGLFKKNGEWLVPTDSTANIAAFWTWNAEFAAACTRLGKMPTFFQSISVPGATERNAAVTKMKFHPGTPKAVESGWAGHEYIKELRANLTEMYRLDRKNITAVSAKVMSARREGHPLYLLPLGHSLDSDWKYAHDPGFFKRVGAGGQLADMKQEIKKEDLFLCISYDGVYNAPRCGDFMERARKNGATLVWSLTDYDPKAVKAITPDEIWINQHWALGDALVPFPGYDVKICPSSGVLAQTVFWMINADAVQ